MAEFFDGLFNSETADTIFGYVLIFGIGLFFYIANWCCFINNMIPGRKWVSMISPIGGLIIAGGILITGGGWWALVGLTDPFFGVLVYSLLTGRFGVTKKSDKEETNENGKHGN